MDMFSQGYKKKTKKQNKNQKKKSIQVFFHEDSQFTWQQGKGNTISLTPLYHF